VVTILSGMSRDNLFVALLVGASLLSMMLLGVAVLLRWYLSRSAYYPLALAGTPSR
jgi:hypothetical protein